MPQRGRKTRERGRAVGGGRRAAGEGRRAAGRERARTQKPGRGGRVRFGFGFGFGHGFGFSALEEDLGLERAAAPNPAPKRGAAPQRRPSEAGLFGAVTRALRPVSPDVPAPERGSRQTARAKIARWRVRGCGRPARQRSRLQDGTSTCARESERRRRGAVPNPRKQNQGAPRGTLVNVRLGFGVHVTRRAFTWSPARVTWASKVADVARASVSRPGVSELHAA